jgi:hypothetical protein
MRGRLVVPARRIGQRWRATRAPKPVVYGGECPASSRASHFPRRHPQSDKRSIVKSAGADRLSLRSGTARTIMYPWLHQRLTSFMKRVSSFKKIDIELLSELIRRKVVENVPRTGDEFQLFMQLPFDFCSGSLPIELLPNVFFDDTPQDVLLSAPRELVSFILPTYGLPGAGIVNGCLHYTGRGTNQLPARSLFSMSIIALRLRKPLPIIRAGQFTFGKGDDPIQDPRLLHLTSAWQPKQAAYEAKDVLAASAIAGRLMEILAQTNVHRPNLAGAVTYFSQVTTGLVQSLQLASLGLWASLEALFLPHNDGETTLARRVSTYLSGFDFSVDLEEWVKSEYRRRRNAYAHGLHVVQPWKPDTDPPPRAFGILHEIVRLCILGFLGMDKQVLLGLQNSRKADLKRCLDGLSPASCRFLDDQVAWLDSKHLLRA